MRMVFWEYHTVSILDRYWNPKCYYHGTIAISLSCIQNVRWQNELIKRLAITKTDGRQDR